MSESGYAVAVRELGARPTAVVAARTTWARYPALWRELLDEVYAVMRGSGARLGCNVMLYRDDVPNVEVGVETAGPVPAGPHRVTASALPAGAAAVTVHRGPYQRLEAAHQAVRAWCAAGGIALAGPRWEIYGDWREDPAELETTVSYLLA